VRVWDAGEGTLRHTLSGHTDKVYAVATSRDGRRALSGGKDRVLRLWDLESGRALGELAGHEGVVRGVSLLPDSHRALSTGEDKTVRLWDLDSGQGVASEHVSGAGLCLASSADGQRVAVGTYDRKIFLWDLTRPS